MNDTYAVATVVGRQAPVSSHLGDRAIVQSDGSIEGFVGGACSRDIVREQALQAMRAGEPRLVHIRPDAHEMIDGGDEVTVPMGCVSEGGVDIYIEPHVAMRRLAVAGVTPVADALAMLAPMLGFEVVRFAAYGEGAGDARPIDSLDVYLATLDDADCARAIGVAASQGHYDAEALAGFLNYRLGYVGLLASAKRGAAIVASLVADGTDPELAATVRYPVGLDIGARRPAEVAISILAEIISLDPVTLSLSKGATNVVRLGEHHCCHHS